MFSTIESPSSRVLRAYLVTEEGRIPIMVPKRFGRLEESIRTHPTEERLDRLAESLSQGVWVPHRILPSQEEYRQLSARYFGDRAAPDLPEPKAHPLALDHADHLNQLLERMQFVRMLDEKKEEEPEARHAIRLSGVEVELWQLELAPGGERLSLRRILAIHRKRSD